MGEASGAVNYYRNEGSSAAPKFVLVSDEWEGISGIRRSVPRPVDLDGDGDLDLVVGTESGRPLVLRNTGTRTAPRFAPEEAVAPQWPPYAAPAFGDLDGDGRPDLVAGSWRDQLAWYRGTGMTGGAPAFELVDSAFVRITRGSNATPTLGDLDGDGDLDLVIGEASGALNYFRNDGTRTAPTFTLVSDEWLGLDVGRRSTPVLADLDGDGDLDLLVGEEGGKVVLLRNAGSRTEPRFEADASFAVPAQPYAAPAVGDLDGDGQLEILLGTAGGGVMYFRR